MKGKKMKNYIYADNAATTRLDDTAFEAMLPYLKDHYANPSQPYSFSRKAKHALKKSRRIIAECINAEPEEIFFTSGGTESDNWVIKKYTSASDVRYVITSAIEHHAVLNAAKNGDCIHTVIPVDKCGYVEPEMLSEILDRHRYAAASCESTLVSVMLANNEIGTIEPVKELAAVAHEKGAVFHTDAVQAVGHIPVDVKRLGVDMLSASSHKFNGPKGIGFLYSKNGRLRPFHDGGAQEFGMRAGTENVAYIVAMAAALKANCDAMAANMQRITETENAFVSELNNIPIDYIRNGSSKRIPGNVSISIKNADGEMLLHRLDLMGICVSTGSACDSVNTQVSHVIKAIGVPEEYAKGTIRISFGKYNTPEEAVEIARAISKICGGRV